MVVSAARTPEPGATIRFFRLVPSSEVTAEDFVSNADKYIKELTAGRKPARRKPDEAEPLHMWTGVSVYDSEEEARAVAAQYPGLGRVIVALALSAGTPLRIERTGQHGGHHTLWGQPRAMLAAVEVDPAHPVQPVNFARGERA